MLVLNVLLLLWLRPAPISHSDRVFPRVYMCCPVAFCVCLVVDPSIRTQHCHQLMGLPLVASWKCMFENQV